MKIRKRLRDKIDLWCIVRIAFLVLLMWGCFGYCLGFYRIKGDEIAGLKDGDLIIYEKVWRQYGYDDVVLYEKGGEMISRVADVNGGTIKGRILALLRMRDLIDE